MVERYSDVINTYTSSDLVSSSVGFNIDCKEDEVSEKVSYYVYEDKKNINDSPYIMFRRCFDGTTKETAFDSVGLNTGNQVFGDSIKKVINPKVVSYLYYKNNRESIGKIDKVITTDLIWINEESNFDYLYKQMEQLGEIAYVPMSIGLQAQYYNKEFKLNESVMRVLERMQERAVLGVRGEYTASILEKHNIKNIEVIGCPSLYYWNDENFKFMKKENFVPNKVLSNFRSIYGQLSRAEKDFLAYCADRNYTFIEQTKYILQNENVNDTAYFEHISKWLKEKSRIYFDTQSWGQNIKGYDFSMGARFHGNIIALWNDIPALFMLVDSRTEELVKFFHLPHIRMEEFDREKPIEYYYEMADYTEFNKFYRERCQTFRNFLRKNEIVID